MRSAHRLWFGLVLTLVSTIAAAQPPLPPPDARSLPTSQTRYLPDTTTPDSDGSYTGDHYGMSIDSDGDWLVVGAPHDGNLGTQRGTADLYKRSATGGWDKVSSLNSSTNTWLWGTSVSIWDNGTLSYIAVGIPGYTGSAIAEGRIVMYRRTNSAGTLVSEGFVAAPVREANARFGASVAVGDGVLVVGADGDRVGGVETGAAYVFRRNSSGSWVFEQKLFAADGASGDFFGASVALNRQHGNRIIVGAPGKDSSGQGDTGAAYMYDFDSGSGMWVADGPRIDAPNAAAGDRFGSAVAMSYSPFDPAAATFAVGMPGRESNRGGAAVYYRPIDDNTIPAPAVISAIDGQAGDSFGSAVDLGPFGSTLLVGAKEDTLGALDNAGSIYFYTLADLTPRYTLSGKYVSGLAEANDRFGYSVAIGDEGEYIVGAPYDSNGLGTETGAFYQIRMVGFYGFGLGGQVAEGSGQSLLNLLPSTRPTAQIDLILSPDSECAISPFGGPTQLPGQTYMLSWDTTSGGPNSWDVGRTVVVTAADDTENEGTHSCRVDVTVLSADVAYNSVVITPETFTVIDNDAVELLANTSFEPGARAGSLSPWKVSGKSGDKVKCGGIGKASACAFLFKGGAGERSKLSYKLNSLPFALSFGNAFEFSFSMSTTTAKAKLVAKFKVKLDGGSDISMSQTFTGSTSGVYLLRVLPPITLGQPPAQPPVFLVSLSNKSPSGKIYIDNVSLKFIGTDGPRDALPPPAVPFGFRR